MPTKDRGTIENGVREVGFISRGGLLSFDLIQPLSLTHFFSLSSPALLREIIESLGFGGSIVARLKLKGIDGRLPPGVECAVQFDSTREISPGPNYVRIDRLKALS